MLRRYQDCDGGSKHEHLSALLRTRSPDSAADETGGAFAAVRRGAYETGDAFAGGKWSEIGRFVRAEVSAVSFRGSDPPALVPSVSGEVVGGCFEVAAAPIGAKNSPSVTGFWVVPRKNSPCELKLADFGQVCRCWANFVAIVVTSRARGGLSAAPVVVSGPAPEKSHAIRLGEVSTKSENVAIPTI